MHRQKAQLTDSQGLFALQLRFKKQKKYGIEAFEELRKACRISLYSRTGRFLYARAMMSEVHRMMCDVAIASLSEEKQKFVMMKFKHNLRLVNISLKLYTSIGQLNLWRQEITELVSRLVRLTLSKEDIFYRVRIVNMVEVLAKLMEFFARFDPEHETASKEFIAMIEDRHQRYQKLLTKLDDAARMKMIAPNYEVVAMRIRFPNDTISVLAERCHMDKGIVSRHLRQFSREMQQYVCEG